MRYIIKILKIRILETKIRIEFDKERQSPTPSEHWYLSCIMNSLSAPTLHRDGELRVVAARDQDGEGGGRAHGDEAQAVQVDRDAPVLACWIVIAI